jgi:DNA-binding transcriptional regulator YhcF (GntR family)
MNHLKHSLIASQLRGHIQKSRAPTLPPIRELCKQYDCAYLTMRKALHCLADEGLVKLRHGSRITVCQEAEGSSLAPGSSAEALYTELKNGLSDGTYRVGYRFPKVDYFAITNHVGRTTVHAAFQAFADNNLAHKEGKHWVAGPSKTRFTHTVSSDATATAPTILIVGARYRNLYKTFESGPFSWFAQSLHGELSRFGFQTRLVLADQDPLISSAPFGKRQIREMISGLGDFYSGALIVGTEEYFADLADWGTWFARFKRPAVYFDFNAQQPHLNRKELGAGKNYFRLSFNERELARAALNTLVRLGHARIAMPSYRESRLDWVGRRISILKREARGINPCPEITATRLLDAEWDRQFGQSDIYSFRYRFSEPLIYETHPASHEQYLEKVFRRANPRLKHLAEKTNFTAFIAPNDNFAQEYFFWFSSLGFKIPQDVSIVSFDNNLDTHLLPLSTVDFGFQRLGYQAAHLFIGDIGIKPDSNGNIISRCELIDRGSIAAPRKGLLARIE